MCFNVTINITGTLAQGNQRCPNLEGRGRQGYDTLDSSELPGSLVPNESIRLNEFILSLLLCQREIYFISALYSSKLCGMKNALPCYTSTFGINGFLGLTPFKLGA